MRHVSVERNHDVAAYCDLAAGNLGTSGTALCWLTRASRIMTSSEGQGSAPERRLPDAHPGCPRTPPRRPDAILVTLKQAPPHLTVTLQFGRAASDWGHAYPPQLDSGGASRRALPVRATVDREAEGAHDRANLCDEIRDLPEIPGRDIRAARAVKRRHVRLARTSDGA